MLTRFATTKYFVTIGILLISLPCSAYFDVLEETNKCDAMIKQIGLKQVERQATNGDAAKEYCIGLLYEWGKDVPKNTEKAAKWFMKSALHGYPAAGTNLGNLYERGDGVPQNDESAIKWYRVAAGRGHILGQYLLGHMLSVGSVYGIRENHAEAAKWLHQALAAGYTLSGLDLGMQYLNGSGVPKNLVVGHALTLYSETLSDTLFFQNRSQSNFSATKLSDDQRSQAEALLQKMKSSGVSAALEEFFNNHKNEYCPQPVADKHQADRYYVFGNLCTN